MSHPAVLVAYPSLSNALSFLEWQNGHALLKEAAEIAVIMNKLYPQTAQRVNAKASSGVVSGGSASLLAIGSGGRSVAAREAANASATKCYVQMCALTASGHAWRTHGAHMAHPHCFGTHIGRTRCFRTDMVRTRCFGTCMVCTHMLAALGHHICLC